MQADDILLIQLSGELDISTAESALWPALEPTLNRARVVLDFSDVTYIDSTALGVLIRKRRIRAERGFSPSHVVGLRPGLQRVFQIVGFSRIWRTFGSIPDAVAAFGSL